METSTGPVTAHAPVAVGPVPDHGQGTGAAAERAVREEREQRHLAPGATRAAGAGNRAAPSRPRAPWQSVFSTALPSR